MSLIAGSKLGPYEILSPAGAGGMGQVYRARDTRLQRDVAIKILSSELAATTESRQRLEREARAISSLSHPNICTLHDIGHQDGIDYLVMEYLEGETLAARLEKGSAPIAQLLEIGSQIADALDKAHRNGVVHRDLKPANIMLTKGGAKLLDFGLAKPFSHPPVSLVASQTISALDGAAAAITTQGSLVGTFQYMSPEQVEGKEADSRSDIFALGCVLYEMATGHRAFEGKSPASTIAAVLATEPPPIAQLQPLLPSALERVVRACLAKDPEERYQTAHDLKLALAMVAAQPVSSPAIPVSTVRRRGWRYLLVAALVLLATSLPLSYFLGSRGGTKERMEFAMPMPGEVSHLALSTDGRFLAFVSPDPATGVNMIYAQRVGELKSTMLAGTDGATYPFWSPDDAYIAFFAQGKLKKIPAAGGVPQALVQVTNPRGGTWGRSGVILYTPDAGGTMWRVNADGTDAAAVHGQPAGSSSHRWATFLPDGEHYLYWGGDFDERPDDTVSGIYLGSLKGDAGKLIVLSHSNAAYSQGKVFFVDTHADLVYAPLDISSGRLAGETRILASGVAYSPSTYRGDFAAAENGTVVYNTSNGAALSTLIVYDRAGKELGRLGEPGIIANPVFSPDGSRMLADINDVKGRNVDLWIDNLNSGNFWRFTFDPAEETNGIWSRDGNTVAYRSVREATVLLKKANGLERERVVAHAPGPEDDLMPNSWSPDGKQILSTLASAKGGLDLMRISLADGSVTPFIATKADEADGQISPDGKWVAYASNDSGDWEVYVTTFPGAAGRWQVSQGGGAEPRWGPDGHEIFFIGPQNRLETADVDIRNGFSVGGAKCLFQIHSRAPISATDLYTYDVAPDGKRIVVNSYLRSDHAPPLTVVLNAAAR